MKKLFLYLFYNFVKHLVAEPAYRIYFDKITYVNGDRMRTGKPCIIASNHPNCLLDVFMVGKKSNLMVHFLANIGIFKPPFWEWFFNTFYGIPIERYMDTGGKKLNNQEAFNRCDEFLIGGGALFIAPQGTSWLERRLGKLKTGTARIGLSAAAKQNFETELEIIPVGVTYKDALTFRKSALIQVGPPIRIADYKNDYETDAREAAVKLTKDLTASMEALVIDAETEERDELLKKHEELLNDKDPLKLPNEFHRTKKVLSGLYQLEAKDPTAYENLKKETNSYYQSLTDHQINDRAVAKSGSFTIFKLLLYILGLPFFLFGLLNNLLSWGIPVIIKNQIKIYRGFNSTIKVLAALVFTPLFYGIQIYLVSLLFNNFWITWSYAILLLPMGIFAWWYHNKFDDFKKALKLSRNKVLTENLTEKRKLLIKNVASLLE